MAEAQGFQVLRSRSFQLLDEYVDHGPPDVQECVEDDFSPVVEEIDVVDAFRSLFESFSAAFNSAFVGVHKLAEGVLQDARIYMDAFTQVWESIPPPNPPAPRTRIKPHPSYRGTREIPKFQRSVGPRSGVTFDRHGGKKF